MKHYLIFCLLLLCTPALAEDALVHGLQARVSQLHEYGYAIEQNDHDARSSFNIPVIEKSAEAFGLVNHLRTLLNEKDSDTTLVRQALVGLAKLTANLPEASEVVGRALATRYIADQQTGTLGNFEARSFMVNSSDVIPESAACRLLLKSAAWLDKKMSLNGDEAKRAKLNADMAFILDEIILPDFATDIAQTPTDPASQKATVVVEAALRLLQLAEIPTAELAKWKEREAGRFTASDGVAQRVRLTDFVVAKPELVRANLLPILMAASTSTHHPSIRQRILIRFQAIYGRRLGPTLDLLPNSLLVERNSNLGQLYSSSYMALRSIVEPFQTKEESLLSYHPSSDFADRSPGAYEAIYQELAARVTSVLKGCFDNPQLRPTSEASALLRTGNAQQVTELVAKARIPMVLAH